MKPDLGDNKKKKIICIKYTVLKIKYTVWLRIYIYVKTYTIIHRHDVNVYILVYDINYVFSLR